MPRCEPGSTSTPDKHMAEPYDFQNDFYETAKLTTDPHWENLVTDFSRTSCRPSQFVFFPDLPKRIHFSTSTATKAKRATPMIRSHESTLNGVVWKSWFMIGR